MAIWLVRASAGLQLAQKPVPMRRYQSHISAYSTAVPANALPADKAARAAMIRAMARAVLRDTMLLLAKVRLQSSYDSTLAPVLSQP
jgi:hypothetical protein